MSRQIILTIDADIDDDRLKAIAEQQAQGIMWAWGHEATAEAMTADGKQAVALNNAQWATVGEAFSDANLYLDDCLERGEEFQEYEESDMDNIRETQQENLEVWGVIKVQRGYAKNFDEHWTVNTDSGGEPLRWLTPPLDPEVDPRHVWTVMDCDGELAISPGTYHVNRLHYITTSKPWSEADLIIDWIY